MRTDEGGNDCPATLGEYRDMIAAMSGIENKAIEFLDDRITTAPHGRDEPVIAPDSQMRFLLFEMLKSASEPL